MGLFSATIYYMEMTTTTTTIEKLIEEKKANFVTFMRSSFGADNNPIIIEQLDMLDKMSTYDFVIYIQHYVKPHKQDNFDSFISGLCATYSLSAEVKAPEVVAKCRRYLELFSEVC